MRKKLVTCSSICVKVRYPSTTTGEKNKNLCSLFYGKVKNLKESPFVGWQSFFFKRKETWCLLATTLGGQQGRSVGLGWAVRAGHRGWQWAGASSPSPAVARGTPNQTIWLELRLPYYLECSSSSLHASGSYCTVVTGSATKLGLRSIVVSSKRSFYGRREMGNIFTVFPHSSFLGLQQLLRC